MKANALCVSVLAAALATLPACKEQAPAGGQADKGHQHAPGENHHDDHGAAVELGAAAVGPFQVKAARGEGAITAGKEASFDLTITGAAGAPKATAVRLWIGTEDAKGSAKAKADLEDPAHPDHWHTHAEVPNPIPAGSKLWIEIETDKAEKHTGSFDLKL